jgi:hypothetical protein
VEILLELIHVSHPALLRLMANFFLHRLLICMLRLLISVHGGQSISIEVLFDGLTSGSNITCLPNQTLGGVASLMNGAGHLTSISPIGFNILYQWSDGLSAEMCITTYSSQCLTGIPEAEPEQSLTIFPIQAMGKSMYPIWGMNSLNMKY